MTKGLALGQLWKTHCCKSADLITDVIDYFREFHSILQGRFICLNFQFHVFGPVQRCVKACLYNSMLWGHSLWGAEEGVLIWGGGAYIKFCLVIGAVLQTHFFKKSRFGDLPLWNGRHKKFSWQKTKPEGEDTS